MKKFKQKIALFVLVTIMVICVSTGIGLAEDGNALEVNVYNYVALGDSLTAGYEPGMNEHSVPYGFVDRLYEQSLYHGVTKLSNYGIVGLTSDGLLNLLHAIDDTKQVTASDIQLNLPDPRVDRLLSDMKKIRSEIEAAQLITITVGGNDFPKDLNILKKITEEELVKIIDDYVSNVTEILQLIVEINPTSKIVIADIYQPFPSFLDSKLYKMLDDVRLSVTERLKSLVDINSKQNYNIELAQVAERFVENELAFTHLMDATDYHPNEAGFKAIAESLSETIWGAYQQPKYNDPISIIIKGHELETPYKPLIIEDRAYVTIKELAIALGGDLEWDAVTETAIIHFNNQIVKFKNNGNEVTVDDRPIELTGPVKIQEVVNNSTGLIEPKMYVPLGSISLGLDLDVKYSVQSRTAFINEK